MSITLSWEVLLSVMNESVLPERSYPYSYQDLSLVKVFVYARIKGINGFQSLQKHLEVRPEVLNWVGLARVLNWVGLARVPHRKTLANRFRVLADLIPGLCDQLTAHVVRAEAVDASIASVDSTLMHAQGNVWHKKQRDQGELPRCGNIDQEAHWGRSGCRAWVYGYRLHVLTLCGPSGMTWPATVSVHPANSKDAQVFDDEFAQRLPDATQILLGDRGYDQGSCYQNCDNRQVTLLAPIKVKKTRHPNVVNAPSFTKTRIAVRFSPCAKRPLSLSKVSSKTFSRSNTCPLKGCAMSVPLATSRS